MGLQGTKVFLAHFLFVGNSLHKASMTFPEFPRAGSPELLIKEGREMQKQEKSNQETIVQPWGRLLVSPPTPSMNIHSNIFEPFCRY